MLAMSQPAESGGQREIRPNWVFGPAPGLYWTCWFCQLQSDLTDFFRCQSHSAFAIICHTVHIQRERAARKSPVALLHSELRPVLFPVRTPKVQAALNRSGKTDRWFDTPSLESEFWSRRR